MTTTTKSRKATKTVQIISRTEFKADSRKVCYQVRASDGTGEYTTCLFDGKATSCTCKSTVKCYHMTQLEQKEAARIAVAQAQEIVSTVTSPIVSSEQECNSSFVKMSRDEYVAVFGIYE